MSSIINKAGQLFTQVLFSIITPPLLIPGIARLSITRKFISFFFGRLYGDRYDEIISSLEGSYGEPISRALERAREILNNESPVIVDCGTGTGFVARQASGVFKGSRIIATDGLVNMLKLARTNCADIQDMVLFVNADTFSLPVADSSVDMVLAQNTMPAFHEFSRVLRPLGLVIYVDTSSGWIAGLARRLISRLGLFADVMGEKVGMGFYVLAQKGGGESAGNESPKEQPLTGPTLSCPIDMSALETGEGEMVCKKNHSFPVIDGIPLLMTKRAQQQ